MALNIEIPQPKTLKPKITIFGVGGAGGNAINNMIRSKLEGVEFVAANTDAQALELSLAENKIQLGVEITKGLGAGSFPDRGRAAAEENIEEIEGFLEGNHMIFIAAGMGGGTGTGAAPVISKLARERDILTVGVVTKPFHFEGKYRMETAQKGIEDLKKHVDTLIVIPNQNLFRIANERTTFESAFKMADDVLYAGVRGITDLITMPGLVNLDFADIRTVMTKMGKAMMGTGESEGENRAVEACEAAIANPLLDDVSIRGARGVLVNMTGGPDMTLFEADLAVNTIKREVDDNANIIFGSAFDENMKGKIRISVVATGIDEEEFKQDILRTATAPEPSKFRSNVEQSKKTTKDNSERKTFFDPGVSQSMQEDEIEEINSSDFKAKKTYLKEENVNYGKADNSSKDKQGKDSAFSQISFFGEQEKDEDEFDDIEKEDQEEKEQRKTPVKKARKVEAPKENNSGFSLFSFMSSSKSKGEEKREVSNEDEDEFSIEIKKPERKAKADLGEQELVRKKQEFFGSTILDEEKENKDSNLDDDILNVPAFFRKKRK